MPGYRKERLEELIKRTIADILLKETKDPRIGFATIIRVKLSRDYSIADTWISIIGDESEKKKTMHGLISARGFIQHKIGRSIRLRHTPKLKFHMDSSIQEGVEMVQLLEDLQKKKPE